MKVVLPGLEASCQGDLANNRFSAAEFRPKIITQAEIVESIKTELDAAKESLKEKVE